MLEGMHAQRRATVDGQRPGLLRGERDYCVTTALAPFIVRLSAGHFCGLLCGHGGTWFPGFVRLFYTLSDWFR
jgi:hypothetical protein